MLNPMRRKKKRFINFILTGSMIAAFLLADPGQPMVVNASSVSEIEGEINKHTNQLENLKNQIVELESEQDILQEQIDDLNAEITNMMASIGLKEDEIAAKEAEIAQKEGEIVRKEEEINRKQQEIIQTEEEYKAAMEREASTYSGGRTEGEHGHLRTDDLRTGGGLLSGRNSAGKGTF